MALAVVSVLALSACESEPTVPDAEDPATAVTLPLQLDGAHASVEVLINGTSARMLLDTGADQIVVSPDAAKRLGLSVRSTSTPGSGASGTYSASTTTIADIAGGSIHRREVTAYVVPFPAEFAYDGVLGTPFFSTLLTTLDYQQRTVTLQANASLEPAPGSTQLPIKLESGKLLVMASAAGVTAWFSIDTGAGNALTFFTPTVKEYGLRDAFSPSVRTITGVSPGGYTRGTLVRVPDVTIGAFALEQVVVELSEAEQGLFASSLAAGNLGGELWRRFKVTLDYPGRQISLTPNDAIAQPFVGPRSGLVTAGVSGATQVIDVVEGSPAAEARLRVGDVIVAMNGSTASSEEITQALRAAPGTHVKFTVRDSAGAEREVSLSLRDLL
jgi:clan AA aspartic protease (TIGR02281 family)